MSIYSETLDNDKKNVRSVSSVVSDYSNNLGHLVNKSSKTVYYKPENNEENGIDKVLPNKTSKFRIDGFAAPHLRKKEVHKVVSYSTVVIDDYGFNVLGIGSWKTSDWLYKLTANAIKHIVLGKEMYTSTKVIDMTWIELFKKSGLQNLERYRKPHTYTEKYFEGKK